MRIEGANRACEIANVKSAAYEWKSAVVGGGGFVPGIVFSGAKQGLIYARTDMGGAYRRENDGQWIPLNDAFGMEESEYYGVLSLGLDCNDADFVCALNGKYTGEGSLPAAFHYSFDRGDTWERTLLPFKAGGNEKGRGTGERIAINPCDSGDIIMGSTRDGLWRSRDRGLTWDRVEGFPAEAVNFVMFDGEPGLIYAAAAVKGKSFLCSCDRGATWQEVPGQPKGLMALRACKCAEGIIITFSDSVGPHGAESGGVWLYSAEKREWKELKLPGYGGGFSGVSACPGKRERFIVSTLNRYSPKDGVFLSDDTGASWRHLLEGAKFDFSEAPYASEITPHWISDVKINPFDPDNALFTTGYGVFETKNLSSATVEWKFTARGMEQAVAAQIVCPSKGRAALVSAMGDIDGFVHENPGSLPLIRHTPHVGTTLSVAYAPLAALKAVKTFNARPPYGAYSQDGGMSWTDFSSFPEGAKSGGFKSAAISADGNVIIWAPKGLCPHRSADNGKSWEKCAGGVAAGLWPVADTRNPGRFYVFDGVKGILWESTDAGISFKEALSGLPKSAAYPGDDGMAEYMAAPVPGSEGDVWLACGRHGLYRYMGVEKELVRISGFDRAYRTGFGKSAAWSLYPSVYAWGFMAGIEGFFRSDDCGKTWIRINDDRHKYGFIHCITGDPRVFGRCYVSAEGRGILYGDETANY